MKKFIPIILSLVMLANLNIVTYAEEISDEVDEQATEMTSEDEPEELSKDLIEEDIKGENLDEYLDEADLDEIDIDEEDLEEDIDEELEEKEKGFLCTINISYRLEIIPVEDLISGDEPITTDLSTSLSIVQGQSLSSNQTDSLSDDFKAIITKASIPTTIENGYDIKASIDSNGNVTIDSVNETEAEEID